MLHLELPPGFRSKPTTFLFDKLMFQVCDTLNFSDLTFPSLQDYYYYDSGRPDYLIYIVDLASYDQSVLWNGHLKVRSINHDYLI